MTISYAFYGEWIFTSSLERIAIKLDLTFRTRFSSYLRLWNVRAMFIALHFLKSCEYELYIIFTQNAYNKVMNWIVVQKWEGFFRLFWKHNWFQRVRLPEYWPEAKNTVWCNATFFRNTSFFEIKLLAFQFEFNNNGHWTYISVTGLRVATVSK